MPTRTSANGGTPGDGERRRLPAAERRHSILEAARSAFSETGDMNGTTIKVIAARSGISEGVIYRHFASKDQLYFEAIVEPLQEAVEELMRITLDIDLDSWTEELRAGGTRQMYKQLTATLGEIVPLLGLVLFGDPESAGTFYRSTFSRAIDELGEGWQGFYSKHGQQIPAQTAARSVVGIALMLALEARFNPDYDLDQACTDLSNLQWKPTPITPEATATPKRRGRARRR